MTIPPTTIYVRPGWASYVWSYAGAAMPSGSATSNITAVAFDASSFLGQQLSRGNLQYSQDSGRTWLDYTVPLDAPGSWLPATGLVWRFQDRTGSDSTPNTFNVHYRLADGSVVTVDNTVIVDHPPASLVGHNDTVFSTLQTGALVDTLAAIDNGSLTNARWVIDGQSQPGLFALKYDPAVDTTARLALADSALLPAAGLSASVTVHYYDRFQLDTAGNPIPGQGVARTLSYTVEDGMSHGLAGLGDDLKLGAGAGADANPALARLSTGGFVAVWQGADTVAGGAGAGLRGQLRDAAGDVLGNAVAGASFALTPDGDARLEGQPAVTALANGRFAVAYAIGDDDAGRIAYRIVEADGTPGVEHVLASGVRGDAAMPAMPTIATLADGSFAVAWRSSGAVHVQAAGADGTPVGAQQDVTALGSAYSPALSAVASLGPHGYVVSWGEMNDGNVYAATSASTGSGAAPFVVSGDGYAASVATAAPLPHVAGLADGGFVVTWDSYANAPNGYTHSDVFFQRFDAAGHVVGNAAGRATQANVDSFGGHYDAAVSALSDGSFVVAWQGGDGDGNGILGRRFALDGTALDEREFAINAGRAGDQHGADIVSLGGGGFAAAWTDVAADGSASVEARVLIGAASTAGLGTSTSTSTGAAPGQGTNTDGGVALGSALLISVPTATNGSGSGSGEAIVQIVGTHQGGDFGFWG
jgi:hypothetical protein